MTDYENRLRQLEEAGSLNRTSNRLLISEDGETPEHFRERIAKARQECNGTPILIIGARHPPHGCQYDSLEGNKGKPITEDGTDPD